MIAEILIGTCETVSIIGAKILTAIWKAFPIIFTALAALGAWLSARATKRAAQGQLFFSLLRQYSSDNEMHNALGKVIDVKNKKKGDSDYWRKLIQDWKDNREDPTKIEELYPDLNKARRCISHYYTTALELYDNKECIDRRFLEVICGGYGFKLLYKVVEHLEQALNPDYERGQFDRLLELCGRSDEVKKQLKRDRA